MAGDEEKPRKSFRERDQNRNRSRHVNTAGDRERERFEKTTAYTSYKQKLDRVFGGGELSPELRDRLDPTGEGKEKDKLLKAVRQAEGAEAFVRHLDAYLAKHAFPDDPYLLDRALDHPRAEVQRSALEQLGKLKDEGKLPKPPASLKQRLEGLVLNADDGSVQDLAQSLRRKL